jgi:hypothetical protein
MLHERQARVSQSSSRRSGRATHLTELSEVNLERLCVVFEPERDHRVEDVLAADRLALLKLALLRRFGRDEAYELRYTLLHALLGVLRDFCCRRDSVLHDTRDICNLRRSEGSTGKVERKGTRC